MDPDEAQIHMDRKEVKRGIAQLEEDLEATAKKVASLEAEMSEFESRHFSGTSAPHPSALELNSALKFYSGRLSDIKRAIDNNNKELARLEAELRVNHS